MYHHLTSSFTLLSNERLAQRAQQDLHEGTLQHRGCSSFLWQEASKQKTCFLKHCQDVENHVGTAEAAHISPAPWKTQGRQCWKQTAWAGTWPEEAVGPHCSAA